MDASLREKYTGAGQADASCIADIHAQILKFTPTWVKYGMTPASADMLKFLEPGATPIKNKAICNCNPGVLQSCMEALLVDDTNAVCWVLTLFFDMLREDSSCFSIFEDALKGKVPIYKTCMTLLDKHRANVYICDMAAWLLSAVVGHCPRFFTEAEVVALVNKLTDFPAQTHLSKLAILEAIVNLLKTDCFRAIVWSQEQVKPHVIGVCVKAAPPQQIYKSVFALWLISFDKKLAEDFKRHQVIKKIKDILTTSRTEKVIRICLTLMKNILHLKPLGGALCEEIVESGMLDAVQNLEFEKWRDGELYDEIKEMVQQIGREVSEMSNFDRYERELQTGALTRGYVHTSKFWGENVMKFEQNDFRALKALSALLFNSTDEVTLAVACHDIGEFVSLHPLGKKKVAQLQIKERVMELMAAEGDDKREVRREALMCCQKIMLNKWQDLEKTK